MAEPGFWRKKPLSELSHGEWEALCDGCGRCCLIKLQDEESREVDYTDVACALLDLKNCRCTHYQQRLALVPDCLALSPDAPEVLRWMPRSCAYRRLAEGKDLPPWHPLITGERRSVEDAGISIHNKVLREDEIHADDLETRIVVWPR
jgi:uncharacterized cysteine cluster protein YcgN (CxxCxxCC family)